MNDRFKKIEGQRFGRLVVISPTEKRDTNGSVIWKCKCDCGNIVEVSAKSLTAESGKNTRSCGCVLKDYQRTKGAQILREEVKKTVLRAQKSIRYLGKYLSTIHLESRAYRGIKEKING